MSLAIAVQTVTHVLLADGWHEVEEGFDLDSYEYVDYYKDEHDRGQMTTLLGGGREQLVPATGFRFWTIIDGTGEYACISGPLTSILAVRSQER